MNKTYGGILNPPGCESCDRLRAELAAAKVKMDELEEEYDQLASNWVLMKNRAERAEAAKEGR